MGVLDMARGFVNKISGSTNENIGGEIIKVDDMPRNNKKTKVRGKVPSRSQRQILSENGISEEEQESYLIHKISVIQEGTDKRLNQSTSKVENWTLIHRESGEVKEVYIK